MQAFLAVLERDSPEIKREMDKGRDEVRIMTVHASKGLEAPVVFLVDSGGDAVHASQMPALRVLPLESHFGEVPPAMLWVPGKACENGVTGRDQVGPAAKAGRGGVPAPALCRDDARGRPPRRLRLSEPGGEPKYRYWQEMVWEALEGEGAAAEARTYAAGGDEWRACISA